MVTLDNRPILPTNIIDWINKIQAWYLQHNTEKIQLLNLIKKCCKSLDLDCGNLVHISLISNAFVACETGENIALEVQETLGRKIHDNPFTDNAIQ